MKKKLLVVLFLLLSETANAQVLISLLFGDKLNTGKIEFGLDGGVNLVTLDGIEQAENMTTWNLGFYFDIKLPHPSWMIHTGVIVKSTLGTEGLPVYSLGNPDLDAALSGGSVATRLQYFNVPIMAKYKIKKQFFVEAGPMLGLLYNASDKFTNTVQESEDLQYQLKTKDAYHPLDAGIMVGVGYRLLGGNGMNLGIRYYYGLVDILIDDSTPNQYNRAWYFSVGIPIGAGKPANEGKK
jgi:Outer membrane protein beta-barrel domain